MNRIERDWFKIHSISYLLRLQKLVAFYGRLAIAEANEDSDRLCNYVIVKSISTLKKTRNLLFFTFYFKNISFHQNTELD